MNMNAEPGENLYQFVERVLENLCVTGGEVMATHNNVSVRVYRDSCEYDVFDKFDMQRRINSNKDNTCNN